MATSKTKNNPTRKAGAKPLPSSKPNKNKLVMWIGVLVLFVILAEVKMLNGPKESGAYNVQVVTQFDGEDQPCGKFMVADVVKVGSDRLAISDNNRLLIFDLTGKLEGSVNQKEAGLPKFNELSNMGSDDQGHFYVMDAWNGLIRGFDSKGRPTVKIPVPQAYGPRGVAWYNGNFYVADTGTHQIKNISADGTLLAAWGHQGAEKGAFGNPAALTLDRQGNIYVADTDNKRVQVLDPQGKFLRKYDVGERVNNVALDAQGRVYASSLEGDFVKVFDKDGKDLGKLTEVGKPDRIHSLKGLAITDDGNIVAATHDKIFIFRAVPAGQVK